MRLINEPGKALIREFEALRLTGYLCPAGVATIGYGHTGPDVTVGKVITKAQAELLLDEDCRAACRKIARVLDEASIARLSDHQYDALVSFVFNLGANPKWTIWKVIKAGDLGAVPAQLRRFVYAGSTKLKGLERRRDAEAALWDSGQPEPIETPSSAVLRQSETPPEPTSPAKPLVQSKTLWASLVMVLTGMVQGAQSVQALVAPQVANSDLLAKVGSTVAVVIVAGGVAVAVFRWLDEQAKHR